MHRSRSAALFVVSLVVGCTPNGSDSTPPVSVAVASTVNHGIAMLPSPTSEPNLYVGNSGTIAVYAPGQTSPLRTIQKTGDVTSLAFDAGANLYAAPFAKKFVEVFPPGSGQERHVRNGVDSPTDVAIDNIGQLYVDNYFAGDVTVYATGNHRLLRTQYENFSQQLAVDNARYLYVSHWYGRSGIGVQVYSAGGKQPIYEITEPGYDAMAIGIDEHDHLYTTNYDQSSVTVYARHGPTVIRRISTSVSFPGAIAFGPGGEVYCACGGGVVEYTPLLAKTVRTITNGISQPSSLAVDAAKNLYVANVGNSSITIYPHGATQPSLTITNGIAYPRALAFGP